jgi:hypothetical protein
MCIRKIVTSDPVLYEHARYLLRRKGVDLAAVRLSKEFAGCKAPDGKRYNMTSFKEVLEEMR